MRKLKKVEIGCLAIGIFFLIYSLFVRDHVYAVLGMIWIILGII